MDLPTHICHNLVRQDYPPGGVEMDTAIYNSHAEAIGNKEEENGELSVETKSHFGKHGNHAT